jgi:hypothetical protein
MSTQNVYFRASENNTHSAGVLNGELGPSASASDATNRSRQVVALQSSNILHFEGVNPQIVETEKRNCILDSETKQKCFHELVAPLKRRTIPRSIAGSQLHSPLLQVHAYLQTEFFR